MEQRGKVTVEKEVVEQVFCNMCGREIKKDSFGNFEDYLHVEKSWGYASQKDGETQRFDLCEDCCDRLIQSFRIKI